MCTVLYRNLNCVPHHSMRRRSPRVCSRQHRGRRAVQPVGRVCGSVVPGQCVARRSFGAHLIVFCCVRACRTAHHPRPDTLSFPSIFQYTYVPEVPCGDAFKILTRKKFSPPGHSSPAAYRPTPLLRRVLDVDVSPRRGAGRRRPLGLGGRHRRDDGCCGRRLQREPAHGVPRRRERERQRGIRLRPA